MSLFSELRRRNVFRVALAYTVTAWLVAQVAELAFDSFGAPDWVMKSLLFILVMGLPFAVIFAWAYELTPEGLKRERDVDRSQSITQETGRKLNYSIIGVLVVALALSLLTRDWVADDVPTPETAEASAQHDRSIAVLPFVNMSDDADNEYFSDGISEELLNVLVRVDGLRVASRTSSFSFKGKDTPLPEIASMLNVGHVLEGSVRKAGNRVRITAQLIDVKTDSHLWSETYDRELEDIFVIQDEISAHIVSALKVALGAEAQEVIATPRHPTENLEAYEAYLRGRHLWQRRGADNIRNAIESFENAIRLDPEFARAWSSLAAAHITMPAYAQEPAEEHYPKALRYAEDALRLDPSIGEAHSVLGDLHRYRKQWAIAEEHYLKAIEVEPSDTTAHLWYGEHLASVGRVNETLDAALMALELDPFHAGANSLAAYAYAIAGDLPQARSYLSNAWDLGHPGSIYNWIFLELEVGDVAAARELIRSNSERIPADLAQLLELLIAAIEDDSLVDVFLTARDQRFGTGTVHVALDRARVSRIEEAALLLDSIDVNGGQYMEFWVPWLAPLRSHPAFSSMLEADGVVDYWDARGWPRFCARQGDAVRCN